MVTVLTITEHEEADHGAFVERLSMRLDNPPTTEAITEIVRILSVQPPKPRKRRSDAGVPKKRETDEPNLSLAQWRATGKQQ